MNTTDFTVTGMTCTNCENHVREEVSTVAGVSALTVSHTTGLLSVTTDGPADAAAIIAAVDEAGYAATQN